MFFEIQINLCERFTALTPFIIRQQKAGEVFLLVKRLNNYTAKENKKVKSNKASNTVSGSNGVIRRPATDDSSWY